MTDDLTLPWDEQVLGNGIFLIFPIYNEAVIIEDTVRYYHDDLDCRILYELIVAKDGSTDDTKMVVRRLGRTLPIRIYTSDLCKGHLMAVHDAVKFAKRDWIFSGTVTISLRRLIFGGSHLKWLRMTSSWE